jgi:hypothetical protein
MPQSRLRIKIPLIQTRRSPGQLHAGDVHDVYVVPMSPIIVPSPTLASLWKVRPSPVIAALHVGIAVLKGITR